MIRNLTIRLNAQFIYINYVLVTCPKATVCMNKRSGDCGVYTLTKKALLMYLHLEPSIGGSQFALESIGHISMKDTKKIVMNEEKQKN